jgi:hypothetical protein
MRSVGYLVAGLLLSLGASALMAGYVMFIGVPGGMFSIWWAPGRLVVMLLNAVGLASEPSTAAVAIWAANSPLAIRCAVAGWAMVLFLAWLLLGRLIRTEPSEPSNSTPHTDARASAAPEQPLSARAGERER